MCFNLADFDSTEPLVSSVPGYWGMTCEWSEPMTDDDWEEWLANE